MSDSAHPPHNSDMNKNRPYRRYLLTLPGFAVFYLLLSFIFTFTVDPYGVWRNGGSRTHDRLIKAIKVSRMKPKTIFLGSSSTVIGLNPDHDDLKNEQLVYNLGLFGPSIYEIRRYFEHALSTNSLNKVILGLDFYAFSEYRTNAPGFRDARIENHFGDLQDYISLYFSLDALKQAADISTQRLYLTEKGSYPRPIDPQKLKEVFESKLTADFSTKDLYGDFQLSESYLQDYRKIIANGKQKKLKVITFIPPIHATLFYGFVRSERWEEYKAWLQDVVAVHPTWDFSGCNSITTQPINPEMDHFTDASHYTPEVGDLLIKRVLGSDVGSIPPDFGVLVTPDNIDEHLDQQYEECLAWEKLNPNLIQWVDRLKIPTSKELS